MKNFIHAIARFISGLKRPSKATNTRLLHERGENPSSFIIREATAEDIPALATLHVKTWSDTYWHVKNPPTYEIREWQWRDQFRLSDGTWFCFVVEKQNGELIGFAKGKKHKQNDLVGYSGELNKIYLLRQYQRLGLGRNLVGLVVRQFLNNGISTMSLYADPGNSSCRFFEKLGGENLIEPNGKVNYSWYVWKDLKKLASICPIG